MRRETPVRLYLTAILLVLLVLAAGVTAEDDRRTMHLLTVAQTVLRPVEGFSAAVVAGIRRQGTYVHDLFVRAATVERLRQEVRSLAAVQAENDYLRARVARLQSLLHLARTRALAGRTVSARVVARNPTTWFSTAVLDRGGEAGIRPGDAVLSQGGLVGVVLSTGPRSAVVLLITDPESGVPIMDARSGDAGLLNGEGPEAAPLAQFFSGTPDVRRGDLVVTSGLGGGIPRGLVVGRVAATRVSDFGLVSSAVVAPAADLDALDDVLVVTRP